MSVAVSIVSAIMKSVVKGKVKNELSNELIEVSLDSVSEKGINKINDFINEGKSKIDNILSEDIMKSMDISEDNMAYVVAEIRGLISEIEITDEIFRQYKYDRFNLRDFLWNEYTENKTGYIEGERDIKKYLLFVSDTLIGLMRESEGFVKDISMQISNTRGNLNTIGDIDGWKITFENKNISIFISYSYDDRKFVDELDKKLQKCGYKIERDIRDLGYTKSIKEFMKRIRKTDYSIIILSDRFLKSENCMREIFEFIKDDNYKDRIIPIILNSAKNILGENKGIDYTIYWKEKEKEFKIRLKSIDEESKSGYIEELKHISMVKDSIG